MNLTRPRLWFFRDVSQLLFLVVLFFVASNSFKFLKILRGVKMRTTHKKAVPIRFGTAFGKTKRGNWTPIIYKTAVSNFVESAVVRVGFVQHNPVADYSSATGLFVLRIFLFLWLVSLLIPPSVFLGFCPFFDIFLLIFGKTTPSVFLHFCSLFEFFLLIFLVKLPLSISALLLTFRDFFLLIFGKTTPQYFRTFAHFSRFFYWFLLKLPPQYFRIF